MQGLLFVSPKIKKPMLSIGFSRKIEPEYAILFFSVRKDLKY
jgi:hypothetical protein